MGWGTRILILYCSFVGLVITLVFMSINQKVDLVTKNYYEQELGYQDRINAINRTAGLDQQLRWQIKERTLLLTFPVVTKGRTKSGSLHFFRPSDQDLDKTLKIPSDTMLVKTIPLNDLKPGFYKLQISWCFGNEDYYNEFNIHL